jgi:hypothetical protein
VKSGLGITSIVASPLGGGGGDEWGRRRRSGGTFGGCLTRAGRAGGGWVVAKLNGKHVGKGGGDLIFFASREINQVDQGQVGDFALMYGLFGRRG